MVERGKRMGDLRGSISGGDSVCPDSEHKGEQPSSI